MTTTTTKLIWSGLNWVGSTYYPVGFTVKNGSNLYRVTVAGTSDASGGPTGTGSGITDNGVTWNYIGPGPDYSSLSNWEAGLASDITAATGNDTIQQARCYAFQDTTACTLSGTTTGSGNYLDIGCVSGESFQGGLGWDVSKYNLTTSTTFAFSLKVSDNYVRISGLQIAFTAASANGAFSVDSTAAAASSDVQVANCIIANRNASASWIADCGSGATTFRNCLLYASIVNTQGGIHCSFGANAATVNCYNCTVVGCGTYGFSRTAGTLTVTNCYSGGNGTDAYNGTMTRTTCAHDTASSFTGSTGSVAYNTSNFTLLAGSSGPNSPSNAANETYISGSVNWTNPTNAETSDNSYATASLSSSISHGLACTTYGFSIDPNAAIAGVKISVEGKANNGFTGVYVAPVVSGHSVFADNNLLGNASNGSDTTLSSSQYYSWGFPLTPAIVNATDFGAMTLAANFVTPGVMSVDAVSVTVYWDANLHLPSGSALIGAGTDLSATFTDDIDGNTRSSWDIGAYKGAAVVASHYFLRSNPLGIKQGMFRRMIGKV